MDNKDYIEKILINRNIPLSNKNNKSVIDLILLGYREAKWSAQGASVFTKKWFPDKPSNTTILKFLLSSHNKKLCPSCNTILDIEEFHKNNAKKDGIATACKACKKQQQSSYYKENKYLFIGHNIKYKLQIRQATPKWADLEKLKEIYANCPEGFHVDHYYPLQGEMVCGLHVPENLQYLMASENISKSNKMPDKPKLHL